MQQVDAPVLTGNEKPHRLDIDKRDFLEIESSLWFAALDFLLDLREIVSLHAADQPDDGATVGQ